MNVELTQTEILEEIMDDIQYKIQDLGIQDLIHDVAVQGSYAKGTDLPNSGSDLDIFIIFNTNVSLEEREYYGLNIGTWALRFYGSEVKDATSKYIESFFTVNGHDMEVQIVQTRHLTLEQIKNKELNGETIVIGMERTPHQTKFMIEALKGQTGEVRKLKQFMKDNGLYDSSMKSQGFSGYATEVLIHNKGSFDEVINYFANDFKVGDVIGEGEGNPDNIFSLIDPIDPSRDLISAFSPMKIGRTIRVCQHYFKWGEPPQMKKPIEMKAVTISYTTTAKDDDVLAGQVRRTQNSIANRLGKMGFIVPTAMVPIIPNFKVENKAMNSDRNEDTVKLSFGLMRLNIDELYKDNGVPIKMSEAVKNYIKANIGCEFITEDDRIIALKKRQFTFVKDAMEFLIGEGSNLIQKTDVVSDIKKSGVVDLDVVEFESLV